MSIFISELNINSLWPSDTIWWHRTGSTLVQAMTCCMMAPSHYLNQCWLIISKVQWHSSEGSFTRDTPAINHSSKLENYINKVSFISPRGQWVNSSNSLSQNLSLNQCRFIVYWTLRDKLLKALFYVLTHWPLGDGVIILKVLSPFSYYRGSSLAILVKLFSGTQVPQNT